MRIIKVRITEYPKSIGDPMPQIFVTLENSDEEEFLFDFYPDEIDFTEKELLGLTKAEARSLKHKKDVYYLRRQW